MKTCSHCNKEFDLLEDWGNAQLCKKCANYHRDLIPKKPKNNLNIIIKNPRFGRGASYNPIMSLIELTRNTEDESTLIKYISHETMHYTLHRHIGIQCCYQYDNVSKSGELDYPHGLQ